MTIVLYPDIGKWINVTNAPMTMNLEIEIYTKSYSEVMPPMTKSKSRYTLMSF